MKSFDFAILPQCYHYATRDYQSRCTDKATVMIVAPDGEDVPGGYECQKHAEACINEYKEKLHETWTLRPLRIYNP